MSKVLWVKLGVLGSHVDADFAQRRPTILGLAFAERILHHECPILAEVVRPRISRNRASCGGFYFFCCSPVEIDVAITVLSKESANTCSLRARSHDIDAVLA